MDTVVVAPGVPLAMDCEQWGVLIDQGGVLQVGLDEDTAIVFQLSRPSWDASGVASFRAGVLVGGEMEAPDWSLQLETVCDEALPSKLTTLAARQSVRFIGKNMSCPGESIYQLLLLT